MLLDSFSTEAPGGGVRWYAYAADGNMVYLVKTAAGTNELMRYTLGSGQLEHVLYLEDAGMSVGEFWDFDIEGDTAIMIESGRVWSVNIAAKKADWLKNDTQATAAQWDPTGVFYITAKGPRFYTYATQMNRDLGQEIEQSGYELNKTYSSIHMYSKDGARLENSFAYVGSDGIFMYDLAAKQTQPVLLDARDGSLVYRHPTFLDNKKLYVQAIAPTVSGATEDAGWYEVGY